MHLKLVRVSLLIKLDGKLNAEQPKITESFLMNLTNHLKQVLLVIYKRFVIVKIHLSTEVLHCGMKRMVDSNLQKHY